MSEHYLKLLYITKHNVNMSDSSDSWRWKKSRILTNEYANLFIQF